jgi:hypothetical protein
MPESGVRAGAAEPKAAAPARRALPEAPADGGPARAATIPPSAPGPTHAQPAAISGGDVAIRPAPRQIAVPLVLGIGAGLRLDLGTLPERLAVGFWPRLWLRRGVLHAAVGITLWPAGDARAASYPRATLHSRAWSTDLSLSYVLE